jgi:hypothetical protein
MKININHKYKLLLLIMGVAFIAFGFLGDDKNGIQPPRPIYKITETQSSGKQGDAYGLNVNNIWMPMNSKGIIAAVNVPPLHSGGQFAGGTFLFSGGFMLSGYSAGTLWANAVASASLEEDYLPGPVGQTGDPNAVLYVVNSQDEAFGQSWQDWSDAVELGADFYDGNGDGEYDPVDLNGDGIWQSDEDMPDLIGDEMVWCIYNDALPVAQRGWNTTIQVGLEIKQSVFAFASAGAIGNLIFVRYRFAYRGLDASSPQQLTDVYFGAWADPDVGDAADDVIGVDTIRNAGYTFNNTSDAVYGNQVPCFMIDFFSGPRAYIAGVTYNDINGNNEYDDGVDTPIDTASSVQGQLKGVVYYPGAMNLPISSFVFYGNGLTGLQDPNDIDEAHNYMQGLTSAGQLPDPCNFAYGEVKGGVDCNLVDKRFWFSGDPVTNIGWLCTENRDMRQMTNTGPFVLEKDQENEIVLAYVVGRAATPLGGITAARAIDDGAQTIFDLNFLAPSPPPPPQVTLSSSDDFIDITWNTPAQVTYTNTNPSWDLFFEGYQVWAFRTNIAEDFVAGQQNSLLIASYDKADYITNLYKQNATTGGIELLYPIGTQLNYSSYSDPATGKIRLRIFNDPFDPNVAVTKGKPYYFAVTSYAVNSNALIFKDDPTQPLGTVGDYYLNAAAFAQEAENIRTINSILVGEDLYAPPELPQSSEQISGGSTGQVEYDPVNNSVLTGNKYTVTFFQDSSTQLYSAYWNLTNTNTGTVYDSLDYYLYGSDAINVVPTEGFITKISNQVAAVDTELAYQLVGSQWVNTAKTLTKFSYVTDDIGTASHILNIGGNLTNYWGTYVNAGQLRRVEIQFGPTQKAYRYLNGFYGSSPSSQRLSFKYAEAISSADTVGKGPVGEWDTANDRAMGFVDVPFQVWVEDPNFGEKRQLTVAFIEKRASLGGNPNGVWDPGTNVVQSGEYILIFDETYDPNGNQIVYKGGPYIGANVGWADLNGATVNNGVFYTIPLDANISQDDRNIANSSFFNTLYAVGLSKVSNSDTWSNGDIIVCGVDIYPYTNLDVFEFQTNKDGELSTSQEQDLWNKVNVYPNPLYGYNELTSYYSNTPDEPFVTFTNLPEEITIKIYSLSGALLRTLTTDDKASPSSPFLNWNLLNQSGLRVASGMYLAIISSPIYGDKTLKFAIIMPQKQIQRF